MLHVFLLLLSLCSFIQAASVRSSKTLVLYDERITELKKYFKYFESLNSRSYEIDYLKIKNSTSSVDLFENEYNTYDNLIIFPIKGKHLNKLVPVKSLLKFYENGGDILAITSPDAVVDSVRLFLNELGIYPSPKDYRLVDYSSKSSTDIEISTNELQSKVVFSTTEDKLLRFGNAGAALLDNREQIVPILRAPRGSVTVSTSEKKKNDEPWTVGSQGYLASGFQSLINARATWVGSQDLFNDKNSKENNDFVQEVSKWTFREKAIIKSFGFNHKHADGTTYARTPYKVKDDVVYEIGLAEWKGDKWEPYMADDIQFELRLVDPYYRLTLTPSYIKKGVQYYTTGEFKLPDHHGVYTFITEYKRNGISFISESDVKAIRHLANDEFARSFEISNAWVYITSIYGVIISWVLFIFLFVIISIQKKVTVEKKKN
ncbi:hypothetical protein TPHA_0I02300 [Tetrapisispora phaffii CBS 4417]|uniref:Dolichyl-diphosphooligosaccharide--protein glycosyltransferase subunit WBP1 n=1 Tax=Tetrapisispora phaffii (strain ATCC 24235 / CBS 4417 / NBRC 1672 / NRRL Y-8282 / UCD 70-5) TaxID=1071381 RepID=G8BXV6_TETPH|nr:hypothetical protein TPHA_0I02300 [Tetrapisispora phaffii CBS 4417]CCE64734.1 hypothetical protein TPHA_0I02300 [Tetrapisispora phaffii CBS 4417]